MIPFFDFRMRVLAHLKLGLSLDDLVMTAKENESLPQILIEFTELGQITGTLDTEYAYGNCIRESRYRNCLTEKGQDFLSSVFATLRFLQEHEGNIDLLSILAHSFDIKAQEAIWETSKTEEERNVRLHYREGMLENAYNKLKRYADHDLLILDCRPPAGPMEGYHSGSGTRLTKKGKELLQVLSAADDGLGTGQDAAGVYYFIPGGDGERYRDIEVARRAMKAWRERLTQGPK